MVSLILFEREFIVIFFWKKKLIVMLVEFMNSKFKKRWCTDSARPPVSLPCSYFFRKDRVTVAEREAEDARQKELEAEAKKQAEERRRYTLKIVEEEAKKEFEENRRTLAALEALDTDGENEEEEYEAWKVRELKRIKRDRESREA